MGLKAALTVSTLLLLSISECSAKAFADKRDAPAKGTKTCRVMQFESAARKAEAEQINSRLTHKIAYPSPSIVTVRVNRDGSIAFGLREDTYPGSKSYFMIAGKRFSGTAPYYVPVDSHALAALRRDQRIDFTWTNWPYRSEISSHDVIENFSAAYDDCLKFLRG